MKLQKLTIHNIASIEDAVIDFEAPPLSDSEVFLITGKTGSGKSTILDAICLALYANTPRLAGTQMDGKTQDGDPNSRNEMQANDPRQVLRRNTGEGYVELTFIGSNGIGYKALWSVKRSRENPNGNLQRKVWNLTNYRTNITLTKDAEIRAEMADAVGLDFQQFCRTTMLAQGEFTRFLNSPDNEKAVILEKITGADIYKKIGVKVHVVTAEKKAAYDSAKTRVADITVLPDEQLQQLKAEVDNLQQQCANISKQKQQASTKLQWMKDEEKLTQQLAQAESQYAAAKAEIESDSFRQQESLVKQWNETIEARSWLKNIAEAQHNIDEADRRLTNAAAKFVVLLNAQKHTVEEKQKLDQQLAEVEDFLSAKKPYAEAYQESSALATHLETIHQCRINIANLTASISKEQSRCKQELQPQHKELESQMAVTNTNLEKAETERKQMEEAIASLKLPELRQQLADAKELLNNIYLAKQYIDDLAQQQQKRNDNLQHIKQEQEAIAELKKECDILSPQLTQCQQKVDELQKLYDSQINSVNDFAKAMRQQLQEGDTCPVCGQRIQNIPIEDELHRIFADTEKALAKTKDERNAMEKQINQIHASVEVKVKALEKAKADFENDTSVAQAEQRVQETCAKCGVNWQCETLHDDIDLLQQNTTDTSSKLTKSIAHGEEQEVVLNRKREEINTLRQQHDTLADKLAEALKAIQDSENRCGQFDVRKQEAANQATSSESYVGKLIDSLSWDIDWRTQPQIFAQQLKSDTKIYETCIAKQLSLSSQSQRHETMLHEVAEAINDLLLQMPQWKELQPNKAEALTDFLTKIGQTRAFVATNLSVKNTAQEVMANNKARLDKFLAEKPNLTMEQLAELNAFTSEKILQLSDATKSKHDALTVRETTLCNTRKSIAEHQDSKPEFTPEDTSDALTQLTLDLTAQYDESNRKVGAITNELENDQKNREKLGTLLQNIERNKADYERWERLNRLIGDATGNTFRNIAQRYVLASLIHSANAYMRKLTDRYTLQVAPGSFLITIRDAYQGFATRAASTISGGESFLVSLSLALALSDIGQRFTVDTLFIDEGFGTLSGEPLQRAVDTLRTLHTHAGRHVGIISHVEELRERITTQILVEQQSNNAKSTVKVQ